MRILITGGAGFIGSFLSDKLLTLGYRVRIFDNLEPQIHRGSTPEYLNPGVEFIRGDVRDYALLANALEDVDIIFHLASRVGVGQSNYQMKAYTDANIGCMANLLDIVINRKLPVQKIIMTASMTAYGEGNYICALCCIIKPPIRTKQQFIKNQWDPVCPSCAGTIAAAQTSEEASLDAGSIYALTKHTQEEMLMLVGKMYRIPVISLRCFNVYGPRQSLSNPYTGVAAIFISRLKNNKRPVVYEDGEQTRDFVSVHDVVDALVAAMIKDSANYKACNIGSGKPTKIRDIATILAKILNKDIEAKITGEYRSNDIRHCFADIRRAHRLLGWKPRISLKTGLAELIKWSQDQRADDDFEQSEKELRDKNLL